MVRNNIVEIVFYLSEQKATELRYIRYTRSLSTHRKEETMSIYAAIVTLVLLLVFVPISLLPLYFDIPRQDDDALAQMRE
jgi:hypothetical protein